MQFGSFSFSLLFDRLCDAQNAIRVKYQITLLNKSKWRPWAPTGAQGNMLWRQYDAWNFIAYFLAHYCQSWPALFILLLLQRRNTQKKWVYVAERGGGRWIAIAKTFSILAKSQKWRAKAAAKVQPKSSQMFDVRKWYTHKCLYLFSICASMYTCVCVSICTWHTPMASNPSPTPYTAAYLAIVETLSSRRVWYKTFRLLSYKYQKYQVVVAYYPPPTTLSSLPNTHSTQPLQVCQQLKTLLRFCCNSHS